MQIDAQIWIEYQSRTQVLDFPKIAGHTIWHIEWVMLLLGLLVLSPSINLSQPPPFIVKRKVSVDDI